jgi:hypothetical protein
MVEAQVVGLMKMLVGFMNMCSQIGKLRRAVDRLIDGYAEGFIAREEFEPRVLELRRRISTLEAKAVALQRAAEEVRSLQLVIGKVSLFADMVRDRLETADWATKRELICTLVKRIEIDDDTVRVIFRVEPGPSGETEPPRQLPHCPTRSPVLWRAQDRQTVRSQPCLGDRQNGSDDLSDPRLQKTAIIPLFDCQPIIPSSRSARRQATARRGGQGGPARRRRAVSLTGPSTVAPFLRSRRRKRLDAEHGISIVE